MVAAADGRFDYEALEAGLLGFQKPADLYREIVNGPFKFHAATAFIFLGIIVLLLVDEEAGTIDRIALSDTTHADATTQVSVKPFNDIRIPLDATDNLIAKVIQTNTPGSTTDWAELFTPELTPQQAHINQANGGIGYSAVYPLTAAARRGALIFSYFQYPEDIAEKQTNFMDRYSAIVADSLS